MDIQDGNAKFTVRSLVKSVNGQHADGNGNVQLYNGLTTLTAFLNTIYPVGSIKISVNATAPFKDIGFGTWTEVGKGRVLWGGDNAGSTIEAGLPNIAGSFYPSWEADSGYTGQESGAFSSTDVSNSGNSTESDNYSTVNHSRRFDFDASKSHAIYGKSSTVQPPAYVVHFWRRTK